MFDMKCQKDLSFYFAIFQIEAAGHFLIIKFKVKLFLHILQNVSSFANLNFQRKQLK